MIITLVHQAFPKPGSAGGGGGGGDGGGDRDGARRRRTALRLLGELVAAGVCSGSGVLLGILRDLVGGPGFSEHNRAEGPLVRQ